MMEKTPKATKFGKEMEKYVEEKANAAIAKITPAPKPANLKKAWMPYYEIEKDNFGKPGNFLLSFSDGSSPQCWKYVDSATLASLMPILNCDGINVLWDVSTKEPLYACGITKRKMPPF